MMLNYFNEFAVFVVSVLRLQCTWNETEQSGLHIWRTANGDV